MGGGRSSRSHCTRLSPLPDCPCYPFLCHAFSTRWAVSSYTRSQIDFHSFSCFCVRRFVNSNSQQYTSRTAGHPAQVCDRNPVRSASENRAPAGLCPRYFPHTDLTLLLCVDPRLPVTESRVLSPHRMPHCRGHCTVPCLAAACQPLWTPSSLLMDRISHSGCGTGTELGLWHTQPSLSGCLVCGHCVCSHWPRLQPNLTLSFILLFIYFLISFYYFIVCMGVLAACISVYSRVPGAYGSPKRESKPLEQEVQMVVSRHVDVGN